MWECNHLDHRSPKNKRNVGICWAKCLTGFKLDATYANIMQHRPTWCTNERNMLRLRMEVDGIAVASVIKFINGLTDECMKKKTDT